ncbi:uncharacterized protein CCOS01_16075 [Colletotrichum costaricense]|uniref:Uncharacterized protein n=1 Tax=Colletotrichum costaricense TaxID=1209916 RepID=A0AAI9YGG9_9PEZI|nr:uncharacterized protein CCOS01_16075 [Colletotrichum costaricense]KAK1508074.1 hypothetical protein CCOS01_16075 [Colletotrichum costaricense]
MSASKDIFTFVRRQTFESEPPRTLHAVNDARRSLPGFPQDINPDILAGVTVKVEESDQNFGTWQLVTHDQSSPLPSIEESLSIGEPPPQSMGSTMPATPLDVDYSFSPFPRSSSQFDRNEAWDPAGDVPVPKQYQLSAPKISSPLKRQRGRPSLRCHTKMTIDKYKMLTAPERSQVPMYQSIRDGFDTREINGFTKLQSTRRRKRSPAPPGIGSLPVSCGIKSASFRSNTKSTRMRERFVIDSDLQEITRVRASSKAVDLLAMTESPGEATLNYFHHTKRNNINEDSGSPRVLPSLRTIEVLPRHRRSRHRSGKLFIISDDVEEIEPARHDALQSDRACAVSRGDSHVGASSLSREASATALVGDVFDDELRTNQLATTDSTTPANTMTKMKPDAEHKTSLGLMSTGETYVDGETPKAWPAGLQGESVWSGAFTDLRPRPNGTFSSERQSYRK